MFIPIYFSSTIRVIFYLAVLYALPAWLLFCLTFKIIRFTDKTILITEYIKPFRKTRRYTYKDISGLSIRVGRYGWRFMLFFPDEKKAVRVNFGRTESFCKFLLDKGIPVISSNGEAWHFINQYKNKTRTKPIRKRAGKTKPNDSAIITP